ARLAAPVLHARTLQPVSGSEIDLQLRCSYTPDQGSTRIERVLASGTGARIVTSHDDVCLIEFQVPASQDFKLAHKEIDQILKRAQVRPLAVKYINDRHLPDKAIDVIDEAGARARLMPVSKRKKTVNVFHRQLYRCTHRFCGITHVVVR
ncbi:hypothetical protein ACUOFC_32905, partial [Escherichia sp. TWPC-MK]